MVRLLTDINFHGHIVRGLLDRVPGLDLVRAQDVGLDGADDPSVLAWAADDDRITLSHDGSTLPDHAYDRMRRGESMPGVVLLRRRLTVGQAIDELVIFVECSGHDEWAGRVVRLPQNPSPPAQHG